MTTSVRSCGTCTACCKPLEAFDGVFYKPAGIWCKHCNVGRGCAIYENRPGVCKGFRCEWLKGFGEEADRPDRVRVILDFHKLGFFDDGVCEIWEVSEGALRRPYTAWATRFMVEHDIPVTHRPLGGKKKTIFLPPSLMFKEIFEAMVEDDIELGSLSNL